MSPLSSASLRLLRILAAGLTFSLMLISYNLLENASSLFRLYFRPSEEHFEQERRWKACDKFAEKWLRLAYLDLPHKIGLFQRSRKKSYKKGKVYATLFVNTNNFRKWNPTSKKTLMEFSLTNWFVLSGKFPGNHILTESQSVPWRSLT